MLKGQQQLICENLNQYCWCYSLGHCRFNVQCFGNVKARYSKINYDSWVGFECTHICLEGLCLKATTNILCSHWCHHPNFSNSNLTVRHISSSFLRCKSCFQYFVKYTVTALWNSWFRNWFSFRKFLNWSLQIIWSLKIWKPWKGKLIFGDRKELTPRLYKCMPSQTVLARSQITFGE